MCALKGGQRQMAASLTGPVVRLGGRRPFSALMCRRCAASSVGQLTDRCEDPRAGATRSIGIVNAGRVGASGLRRNRPSAVWFGHSCSASSCPKRTPAFAAGSGSTDLDLGCVQPQFDLASVPKPRITFTSTERGIGPLDAHLMDIRRTCAERRPLWRPRNSTCWCVSPKSREQPDCSGNASWTPSGRRTVSAPPGPWPSTSPPCAANSAPLAGREHSRHRRPPRPADSPDGADR